MASIDPNQVERWLRGEMERKRIVRFWLGCYNNYLPAIFGWKFTPLRLITGGSRLLFMFALALWPFYLKNDRPPTCIAVRVHSGVST